MTLGLWGIILTKLQGNLIIHAVICRNENHRWDSEFALDIETRDEEHD